MRYDRALSCTPVGFSYLCERAEGLFFHEVDEVADMLGLVAFFKRMDPDVRVISTFAGPRADSIFVLHPETGWLAYDPPRGDNPPQPKTPMVRH